MKKIFYITAFTFLGYLLQQLLHAIIEIGYIRLLLLDFRRYSLGFSWSNLVLIHHILTFLLLVLGLWMGFRLGKHWWKELYDENGLRRKVNLTK